MQKSSRNSYRRSILLGALTGLGIALVFAAGFFFHDLIGPRTVMAVQSGSTSASGYPLLDEVQNLLDRNYLRDQPSQTERTYGAIRGMLATLNDRYTFFVDPPVAQSESDVLAGAYGGIGVQIQRAENGDLQMFPYDGSPAQAAGVDNGDVLKAINGQAVDPSTQPDALDQMMRGEVKQGSGVTLTFTKHDTGQEHTQFIAFAEINVPSVIWRVLPDNNQIGYVQVLRFTSRTPDELTNALNQLNAAKIGALVLDLRNNSGGLLLESVKVADEFLDHGVIVYERNRAGEAAFSAEAGGLETQIPMVVLVNQNTASGAELVAGALQDNQRAILIGQTTYGKGSVQQIFTLSDNSSLHITSAEWLTPNQNHLEGSGLAPDVPMIPDSSGRDVELGEAVRRLVPQITQPASTPQ